jgi:hypothetical protein
MPTTTIAQPGDTLCNIAHINGFNDCTPLRNEPANAFIVNRANDPGQVLPGDVVTVPDIVEKNENGSTEQVHNFVKRTNLVTIRFVHGSPNLPYKEDLTLINLNISNYIANRAGTADGNVAFPADTVRRFNNSGHQDPDTFKVEVTDLRASGDIKIDLEALRPIYTGGIATRHEQFPAAIRADRQLLGVLASVQGSTKTCFRTCYLKLVVDDLDKGALSKQALLVSDMHAAGDSQVEILDQLVRASYTLTHCPANPKCKASVTLPIGTDRQRMRLAIHVLRATPGGALIVPLADIDKRVHTWFRRVYAQASIAPKLMQATRGVDPPANLIAISNDHGASAAGDGTLTFKITAPGHTDQTIIFNPVAGATPRQTADAIAGQITAPFQAEVSDNPARANSLPTQKSADIIITASDGARVTVTDELGTDSRQTIVAGRVDPTSLPIAIAVNNMLIGTPEQRAVLKNHDTGDDRVDFFVVTLFSPDVARGLAMISGHRIDPQRAAVTKVKWSGFLIQTAADGTDHNPFSFPHEAGHTVGEVFHAQSATAQWMRSGTSGDNEVNGSKRIRDGAVNYDNPGTFNMVDRLRIEGAPLFEAW